MAIKISSLSTKKRPRKRFPTFIAFMLLLSGIFIILYTHWRATFEALDTEAISILTIPSHEVYEKKQKLTHKINDTHWFPTTEARNFFASPKSSSCSIHLFGLPRAFKALVLPSLQRNVIPYNPTCDYFVHYYNMTSEGKSRSGAGGTIRADDIFALTRAVHAVNPNAVVQYVGETDDEFQQRNADLLDLVKEPPYKPDKFTLSSTLNIIRMWNSIQSSWNLMQQYHNYDASSNSPPPYRRVAFLRSDVLYYNPVQIWAIPPMHTYFNRKKEHQMANKDVSLFPSTPDQLPMEYDYENQFVIVPSFAAFPVNDRFVAGPFEAVRIWAAKRLTLMHKHVTQTLPRLLNVTEYEELKKRKQPSFDEEEVLLRPSTLGIHDERLLEHTIFPKIRNTPLQSSSSSYHSSSLPQRYYSILEHESLCFVRVRADQTIWSNDCEYELSRTIRNPVFRHFSPKWLLEQRYGAAHVEGKTVNYSAVIQTAISPFQKCQEPMALKPFRPRPRQIVWECRPNKQK